MPAFGLQPSSSSTHPYISDMKSSSTATKSLPPNSSCISSPQFTFGTSVTTFPVTRGFSSLSPSFTPFYPQSQQKYSLSTSDSKAGTFNHEGYDLNQSMDGSHSNYHSYTTHSLDVSSFANYTDYTGLTSDYKYPWTSHGYYGVQPYDPWGSRGRWQEFSPTSDYVDSSHWGEPSSVEYLYANACTGEVRSSSYFPSDLLSYPPESALSEEESCTSSPRNRVFGPLPESCASSSAILLSNSQGEFAPSSSALNGKSVEEHAYSRCPQNNKNWKVNVSKVPMGKSGTFVQERQPILNNDCGKKVSDGREGEGTENGFVFSELKGELKGRNGEGEKMSVKQGCITQEGLLPSSCGLTCIVPESLPEQCTANSQEEDQLQSKQDELIQKSSIVNIEQGSQEKGERKTFVGQDPTPYVSSVPPQIVGKDSTLVSLELSPQSVKPMSLRIVQGATEKRHCLSVNSGHSSQGGRASGSASCTGSEHTNAKVFGLSPEETSKLEQKVQKLSANEARIPLSTAPKQNFGKEFMADDDQEAESCKDSDCVIDLSCVEKACSKNDLLPEVVQSSNGCELLISSIYNLSSVLVTNQLTDDPNCSVYMDSHALGNTICNLSYCLWKQSSNNLAQRCDKASMNFQLIHNPNIPNLSQGFQGKGLWKDAPHQSSMVSSFNAENSTDATLGSEQMVYQSFESFSAGSAQGTTDRMQTKSAKSSWPSSTNEHFSASNTSGFMGCKRKSNDCACSKHIDVKSSLSPVGPRSHLQKKAHFKSSCNDGKVSLLREKNGFFDSVQNAQGNDESTFCSDSFQDKVYFDNGLLSKNVPSLNCGQLLISSMCNLSRVLLTSQSAECSNGSEYVDLYTIEKAICYLSHCLLMQSSDNLGSLKPIASIESIQKSNVVNTEQGLQGEGVGKDAFYHASFRSGDNFQSNKESTLGSQQMPPECLDSIPAEIVQGAGDRTNNPSFKNSGGLASKQLRALKDMTGVTECPSVSTNHADPKHSGPQTSGSSLAGTSNLEINNPSKSFIDDANISLAAEVQKSCNDGVILNDVQKAQSNEDSKCDLMSSHLHKESLSKVFRVKVAPSLSCCHMLISSMHNLSKVLFSHQNSEHPSSFSYVDLDAMEHSMSMLSDCLLKQSSDIFGKTCHEPIEKSQQKCQEELHGQKIVGEADVKTGPEDWACLQESSINDTVMEPSLNTLNQRMFLSSERILSSSPNWKDPPGTCLEIGGKLTCLKRRVEEAASSSIIKHVEKPLEKVFELQDKFVKLQDDIAYERNESNTVLSTYKSLWREAHEALCHSRSEITEIQSELEGLKQSLRELKNPGSNQSDSKCFDPGSIYCERDMPCLNQEELPRNTSDFIPHSTHSSKEEQQHSKSKLESEASADFLESWGRGLPKNEEVMTGYFGPLSSAEVDLESAVAYPDAEEVISRLSLLQARGACSTNDNKGETPCNSRIDVDEGVAQRLSLLLARQSFDLNLSCSENIIVNEKCPVFGESLGLTKVHPVFGESLGLGSDPLNIGEGVHHDKTLNSVSQLPTSLNSEMLNAESVEQQGFGMVDSRCLDWNCVSKETQGEILKKCHGSSDGWMQVKGRGNTALQIESSNCIDLNSNSQDQLQCRAEFLQDRELKMSWSTHQQEETEIICLRPTRIENRIACLEGDADWEHVVMSAT